MKERIFIDETEIVAGVTFGNADMSIRVAGTDFTLDEVIAVAESISW